MISKLPPVSHERLLVGTNTADDAGVYKLTDEIALIQTIDVFTPVVDDPYMYGKIAAANSISDVYAMGGKPISALNFIGFTKKELPLEVMSEILRGGYDKASEAEIVMLGGHSIIDPEVKYGLAVTGVVHPDKIITNASAKPGDVLFLTKPIGTGILSTALKQGKAGKEEESRIISIMEELNRKPAELMQEYGANSCTDITGYGLLGHAYEMASASGLAMRFHYDKVPMIEGALDFCRKGTIPGGTWNNKKHLDVKISLTGEISEEEFILLFDAQTSGGLLVSMPEDKADGFEAAMKDAGIDAAARIGETFDGPAGTFEIVV